jgi:hypothetical protein
MEILSILVGPCTRKWALHVPIFTLAFTLFPFFHERGNSRFQTRCLELIILFIRVFLLELECRMSLHG